MSDEPSGTPLSGFASRLDKFADTHLYLGAALLLTLIGTGLLVAHLIASGEWTTLVQWVWASTVGGGAASAYRK